jgi:hypothetical protein
MYGSRQSSICRCPVPCSATAAFSDPLAGDLREDDRLEAGLQLRVAVGAVAVAVDPRQRRDDPQAALLDRERQVMPGARTAERRDIPAWGDDAANLAPGVGLEDRAIAIPRLPHQVVLVGAVGDNARRRRGRQRAHDLATVAADQLRRAHSHPSAVVNWPPPSAHTGQ